jgi:hypothetical protein
MVNTRRGRSSLVEDQAEHDSDEDEDDDDDIPISELRIDNNFINDVPSPEDREAPPRTTCARGGLFRHPDPDEGEESDEEDEEEEEEEQREPLTTNAKNKKKAKPMAKPKAPKVRIQDKCGKDENAGYNLVYVGFYHSQSHMDLDIVYYDKCSEFFHQVFVDWNIARERGDGEEWLHNQGQGEVYAPEGKQG